MEILALILALANQFLTIIHEFLPKIPSIAFSIFGFGFLIFFHECGHFLFARLFGVGASIFSIGFGPVLAQTKFLGTNFKISLIPLGGFVQLKDSSIEPDAEQPDSSGLGFDQISYPKKFLILSGGVLFNAIFAIMALTASYYLSDKKPHLDGFEIVSIEKDRPGQKAGLKVGDIITGIENNKFDQTGDPTKSPIRKALEEKLGKNVCLNVLRASDTKEKVQVALPTQIELDQTKQSSILGVGLVPKVTFKKMEVRHTFITSLKIAIFECWQILKATAYGFAAMLRERKIGGMSGPVEIISTGVQAITGGILMFLRVLAIVSLSLAFFNIIPFGPLDGSQLFVVTMEAVFRRKLPILEHYKLATTLMLLALLAVVTFNDLLRSPKIWFLVGAIAIFMIFERFLQK